MGATLIDKDSGLAFDLREGTNTLGRREENDICLPSRGISRYHAEIRFREGRWYLEDQGSTYGTYLNGEKVEGVAHIRDGDTITFAVTTNAPKGELKLTFHDGPVDPAAGGGVKRVARKPPAPGKVKAGQAAFERRGRLLVVRLAGIFRRGETNELADGIHDALDAAPGHVLLDVRQVSYMNSYALGILVALGVSQRSAGHSLRVFGATGSVRKLLESPGAASPIEFYDSEEEGLRP